VIELLALYALLGTLAIAFGAQLGRRAFVLATLAPLATLVWFATKASDVFDGGVVTQQVSWVDGLGLELDFRLDGFGALMLLLITGIGVGIGAYSMRYFPAAGAGVGRLAGLLTLFGGAMVGLVLADNLFILYTCWEVTAITSYLLIGHDHTKPSARSSALQALLVTSAGGLAMLAGFVLLGQAAGTYRLSELLADPPSGTVVTVALVLVLLGAFTKSAQYPFHSWLPAAMAAPTPVSAYLHSATMVKAGVYLTARFAPAFATTAGWRPLVLTIGAFTMVCGGLRALRQRDLKLLLAFGTVSQLGFLMVLFGAGTEEATAAGCVLIIAHAAFKAALFMVVGIIDHETGTRDVDKLPQLGAGWTPLKVVAGVSLLSMAGVVPMFGFIGKEAAYEALLDGGFTGASVELATVVVGSVFTFAYAATFWWGAFVVPRRQGRRVAEHAPSGVFLAPAAVLAGLTTVFGLVPGVLDRVVDAAATSLDASVPPQHLAIWHGLNATLVLSFITIGAGGALFAARVPLGRVLSVGSRIPSGDTVYRSVIRGLNAFANGLTGVVQSGSLPVYAGVIILTAVALPGAALLIWGDWPGWPQFVDTPAQIPIVVVLLGCAIGAAAVRRRFSAALFLGTAGYAMAGLFVVQGAPDLALTQTAIETLSTVLFVLVLRRLPDRFERVRMPGRRAIRVLIATTVGVTVFAFAMYAAADRRPATDTVSAEMVERSVPDGHGRNVVNVILVDFRGFDTLGEITVLAAAAIGAVALARAGRVPGKPGTAPAGAPVARRGIERLVFLDVSVRLLFHATMVGSLWLLFAGHNQPGGGFAGGLLAGAAVSLRFIAGGIDEVRAHSRFRPWTILGGGLLLAACTAAAPLLAGNEVLESAYFSRDLGWLGTVKVTSALPFDIGVYLVVVGLVLMVFEAFGEDPEVKAA
jgi:multicomponent Na+:H+ antiporter subunit A